MNFLQNIQQALGFIGRPLTARIIASSVILSLCEAVTLYFGYLILTDALNAKQFAKPAPFINSSNLVLIIASLIILCVLKIIAFKIQQLSIQNARTILCSEQLNQLDQKFPTDIWAVPNENYMSGMTTEIDLIVERIYQPIAQMVSSLTTAIFIFIYIAFQNPVGTGYMLVSLYCIYYIISKVLQKLIEHSKNKRIHNLNLRVNILTDMINGIEVVRELGFFERWSKAYTKATNEYSDATAGIISIPHYPKYFMETLVFIILALAVSGSSNDAEAITLLALFGVSLYKILPSAQLFYNSFSQFNSFSAGYLEQYALASPANNNPIFEIKKSKYHDYDITWELQKEDPYKELIQANFGDVILIDGPSGVGKSTLLRKLAGVQPGLARIHTQIEDDYSKTVAYVDQTPKVFNTSLSENIFRPNNTNFEQHNELLSKLDLNTVLTRYGFNDRPIINKNLELSGGEKQRIALLRAVANQRPLLFLDEPTSALDTSKRDALIEILKSLKDRIIILVTHDIELKKLSNIRIRLK